jgi:integrase
MGVYKNKDRDGWYFRTSIEGKQYKRSPFTTKKEAVDAEAKFRANFTNHEAESYKKVTVQFAVDSYLAESEKSLKTLTLTNYTLWINKHIREFFGSKDINRINKDDINKWRLYIDNQNFSVAYKNKILRLLRTIFKFSNVRFKTSNQIMELEPTFRSDVPIKERNSTYNIDEFNRFISVIDNTMYKAFFTLLFFTGMRFSEIRALTWEDINIDNSTVNVNKIVTTKVPQKYKTNGYLLQVPKTKSSIRTIYYADDLVNPVIEEYMKSAINLYGFKRSWFVFGQTSPLSETNVTRLKNNYAKKAKLHQIKIHDFRHSYISMLYENNVDVAIAKELAGHSSINTTINIYTHISPKNIRDSVNKAFDKHSK